MAGSSAGAIRPKRGSLAAAPVDSRVRALTGALAHRRVGFLVATALAVVAGLASDLFAVRGPITAVQALAVMALALALGLLGGALARTRWVVPALFIAYAVGVELARRDLVAASLQVRFDNTYGIIEFALARGLHGFLVLPPLALGVLAGIAFVGRVVADRDAARVTPARRRRPIGTAIVALITVALAVLVAWPSSTPPVVGPDGRAVAGSIAELARIQVGGTEQTVMIRAANPDSPVILYLAGGPGQSDLALARAQVSGWEQDFVFAALDQRGNGTSYAAIDPTSALTLDRAVADVIEVTDYLRQRFGERKVYLMGESWGTILGVLAVQRRPDLYHAWIGSGQMVNILETDKRIYRDLVAYAERTGDTALLADLRRVGEPPYADFPWANSNLLAWYEYIYPQYTPSAGYIARGEKAALDPFGVLGSEYSFVEKANVLRGLIDTFALMYPQLYGIDFRRDAARLDVPVYMLDGAAELRGRRDLALDWFDRLQAPVKQKVTYANAAHATAFEQGDDVLRLLNEVIVPTTYGME